MKLSRSRSVALLAGLLFVAGACTTSGGKKGGTGGNGGTGGSAGTGGTGGSAGTDGAAGSGGKGGSGGTGGTGGSGGGGGSDSIISDGSGGPKPGAGKPGSNTMSCGDISKCLRDMMCKDMACYDGCITSTKATDEAITLWNDYNGCFDPICCIASSPCGDMCSDKAKTCTKACGSCFQQALCAGATAGHCLMDAAKACTGDADCGGDMMKNPCVAAPGPSAKCAQKLADCYGITVGEINCYYPDRSKDTCGGP